MWVSDQCYELLGTRFRVQSQDRDTAHEVDRLLQQFRVPGIAARGANTYSIVKDGDFRLLRDCSRRTSGSQASLVNNLVADLNRQAVGSYSGFASHAGVVGHGDRTLAFIGDSGSGKSTLVAACLTIGFTYGSDEALCLDYQSSAVVPYPKPIALDARAFGLLAIPAPTRYEGSSEAPITATDLDADLLGQGRKLTDLVIHIRQEGVSPVLEPIPASDGMAALLSRSFNHYVAPAAAFRISAEIASSAKSWSLAYDNPIEAAKALMEVSNYD